MDRARTFRGIALLCGVSLSFLLCACQSKLPGPLDCESMALKGLGRSSERVRSSPAARHVMTRLVHGCLTTPFDIETVECVNRGHSLRRCADELASREPSRVPALNSLLADLAQDLSRLRERNQR